MNEEVEEMDENWGNEVVERLNDLLTLIRDLDVRVEKLEKGR